MQMALENSVLLVTAAILLLLYFRRAGGDRFPPGPRPLPILGNILDFPRNHLGREFQELSRRYGQFYPIYIPIYRAAKVCRFR